MTTDKSPSRKERELVVQLRSARQWLGVLIEEIGVAATGTFIKVETTGLDQEPITATVTLQQSMDAMDALLNAFGRP